MRYELRIVGGHVHTLEKLFPLGMYEVRIRAGNTLISRMRFDTGREAWNAYRLSADTFMERFD